MVCTIGTVHAFTSQKNKQHSVKFNLGLTLSRFYLFKIFSGRIEFLSKMLTMLFESIDKCEQFQNFSHFSLSFKIFHKLGKNTFTLVGQSN